jgi:hypothetical protein
VLPLHYSRREAQTKDTTPENEDETKKTREVQKKNEKITLKLKQLKYHA